MLCLPCQARAAAAGDKPQPMAVLCSDSRRQRFYEYDELKNVYGCYYHVREPETQRLEMTFPEFVQCSQRWQARRLLLKVRRGREPAGLARFASALGCGSGIHISLLRCRWRTKLS